MLLTILQCAGQPLATKKCLAQSVNIPATSAVLNLHSSKSYEAKWSLMPKSIHLLLFGATISEHAQHTYKKERKHSVWDTIILYLKMKDK